MYPQPQGPPSEPPKDQNHLNRCIFLSNFKSGKSCVVAALNFCKDPIYCFLQTHSYPRRSYWHTVHPAPQGPLSEPKNDQKHPLNCCIFLSTVVVVKIMSWQSHSHPGRQFWAFVIPSELQNDQEHPLDRRITPSTFNRL